MDKKKTSIIRIGNSKGVRIPKSMLAKSALGEDVVLKVKPGEIKILPSEDSEPTDTALLSSKALAADWLKPEEDEAWKNL